MPASKRLRLIMAVPSPEEGGNSNIRDGGRTRPVANSRAENLPLDRIEHAPQPFRAGPVEILDPGDPSIQMGAKIAQPRPVFRLRSIPDAVVQRRLQRVIVGTRHIDVVVDDDSGHALAAAAP